MARLATRAEHIAALEACAFLPAGEIGEVTEARLAEVAQECQRQEDYTEFDYRERTSL